MVVGTNPRAGVHLDVLKIAYDTVPRFRNTYRQGDTITIMTRTGGNNRGDYKEQNAALQAHPQYVKDFDDTFDSTFAHFVFKIPDEMLPLLITMPDDRNPMDVFQEALKELKNSDDNN